MARVELTRYNDRDIKDRLVFPECPNATEQYSEPHESGEVICKQPSGMMDYCSTLIENHLCPFDKLKEFEK